MVKPAQSADIMLTNINHPDILSTLNLTSPRLGDTEDFYVELLWQDTPGVLGSPTSCIKQIEKRRANTVNTSSIRVTAGDVEGNAVVALKKQNTGQILWSWHIWVTHYQPDDIQAQSANGEYYEPSAKGSLYKYQDYLFMDRFLGATFTDGNNGDPQWIKSQWYKDTNQASTQLLAKASGFFYQWGRKDPILTATYPDKSSTKLEDTPVYDANGNKINIPDCKLWLDSIKVSIENPLRIMYYSFYNEARSWGTSKSKNIFDPCPEGWRVPHTPLI
ncbi:MAG: hypothetical protein LBQ65_04775, partial [Tannerellaceae bacterium]|nr:hypothetical protein [Tannerellaceae bacterium]